MREITDETGLNALLDQSEREPVFLFKHSTACPISAGAMARVREHLAHPRQGTPPFFLLKVIESRALAQESARRLGVKHESPQLILVRDRRAVWHTSHHRITADAIEQAVSGHGGQG